MFIVKYPDKNLVVTAIQCEWVFLAQIDVSLNYVIPNLQMSKETSTNLEFLPTDDCLFRSAIIRIKWLTFKYHGEYF